MSFYSKTKNIQKIAVFRATQLGGLINLVPAIRALRYAYPEAQITLIGLPWAESFVQRYTHYLDTFIPFYGYPGLQEQENYQEKFIDFLHSIRTEHFDLLFQLQGNGVITNPLLMMFSAKHTAGFYKPGHYIPDKDLFLPFPENQNDIVRQLILLDSLGIPLQGSYIDFPVYPIENTIYSKICRIFNLMEKEYVCLHPGAQDKSKRWAVENYIAIADFLAKKGYKIVLTGSDEEKHLSQVISDQLHNSCINVTGLTPELGVLANVIKNAALVITNDTGISNIAASVQAPSVIIFQNSDPKQWAPLNKKLHKVITKEQAKDIKSVQKDVEMQLVYATEQINQRFV